MTTTEPTNTPETETTETTETAHAGHVGNISRTTTTRPTGPAEVDGIELMVPLDMHPDNVAQPTGGHKIFTVTLEFELDGPGRNHSSRLKEAYRAAIVAAEQATRERLTDRSITGLKTRVTYGYRQLEGETVAWDV